MKKLPALFFLFFFIYQASSAQGVLDKLKKKVKDKTDQRVDDKTDKAIDKTLDDADPSKQDAKKNSDTVNDPDKSGNHSVKNEDAGEKQNLKTYANYDFVPGDKIIFQSQLADEKAGEIASQFILSNGQMDVQQEDGENVIHIPAGPGATMTPRMSNQNYMPDQFTIEFDFKNEKFGIGHVMVDFGQRTYYSGGDGIIPGMTFGTDNSMGWTLGDVAFPKGLDVNYDHPMQWHHVAIAINKNVGKVYVDQYRVASVNNLNGKANNVTIDVNGYENSFIKNVRIASGGIDIYKKITTEGKIVTHGILFDLDKASIRPESMGTINSIYDLLKKDPTLKFEIDGHTDNTGNSPHNLSLSQQRADAVKAELTSLGIDASRLSTKGFGDVKPIDKNDTPEGRANNRRVEFVKM